MLRPHQLHTGGPNEHPRQCPPDAQRSRGYGPRRRGSTGSARPPPPASSTPRPRPSPSGSRASRPRASLVCATDPQNLFHRQAKSRSPQPMPSRLCAVSAAPRSTSPPSSASPRPPSRASSNDAASACSRPRAAGAKTTLRTREARRDHPYRHQKARPFQCHRPSHHRRSSRPEQCARQGSGPGWEFVHVAIDDHSRVATAAIFPDEKKKSAVAFLRADRRLLSKASASPSSAS